MLAAACPLHGSSVIGKAWSWKQNRQSQHIHLQASISWQLDQEGRCFVRRHETTEEFEESVVQRVHRGLNDIYIYYIYMPFSNSRIPGSELQRPMQDYFMNRRRQRCTLLCASFSKPKSDCSTMLCVPVCAHSVQVHRARSSLRFPPRACAEKRAAGQLPRHAMPPCSPAVDCSVARSGGSSCAKMGSLFFPRSWTLHAVELFRYCLASEVSAVVHLPSLHFGCLRRVAAQHQDTDPTDMLFFDTSFALSPEQL